MANGGQLFNQYLQGRKAIQDMNAKEQKAFFQYGAKSGKIDVTKLKDDVVKVNGLQSYLPKVSKKPTPVTQKPSSGFFDNMMSGFKSIFKPNEGKTFRVGQDSISSNSNRSKTFNLDNPHDEHLLTMNRKKLGNNINITNGDPTKTSGIIPSTFDYGHKSKPVVEPIDLNLSKGKGIDTNKTNIPTTYQAVLENRLNGQKENAYEAAKETRNLLGRDKELPKPKNKVEIGPALYDLKGNPKEDLYNLKNVIKEPGEAKVKPKEIPKEKGLIQKGLEAILPEPIEKKIFGTGDGFIDSIKKGWERGNLTTQLGHESYKEMIGEKNKRVAIEKQMQQKGDSIQVKKGTSWLNKGIGGAMEQIPMWIDSAKNSLSTMAWGAVAGAGTAVAIGQMGPQAIIPEEVVTVPLGALGGGISAGLKAGQMAGAGKNMMEIEGGLAYNEYIHQGIDPKTARVMALSVGAVNAGIEFSQLDTILKTIPLGKKALDQVKRDVIKNTGKEVLKKYGKTVAQETLQEVAQETVTIAGGQLGVSLHNLKNDKKLQYATSKEIGSRLLDTGIQSALSFGVLSGPGHIIQYGGGKYHNVKQKKDLTRIDTVLDNVTDIAKDNPASIFKNTANQTRLVELKNHLGDIVANNRAFHPELVSKLESKFSEIENLEYNFIKTLSQQDQELILSTKSNLANKFAQAKVISENQAANSEANKELTGFLNSDKLAPTKKPESIYTPQNSFAKQEWTEGGLMEKATTIADKKVTAPNPVRAINLQPGKEVTSNQEETPINTNVQEEQVKEPEIQTPVVQVETDTPVQTLGNNEVIAEEHDTSTEKIENNVSQEHQESQVIEEPKEEIIHTSRFGPVTIIEDDGKLVKVKNEQGNIIPIGKKALKSITIEAPIESKTEPGIKETSNAEINKDSKQEIPTPQDFSKLATDEKTETQEKVEQEIKEKNLKPAEQVESKSNSNEIEESIKTESTISNLDDVLNKVLEIGNAECTIKTKKWEKNGKKRYYLESNQSGIGWIGTEPDGSFKYNITFDNRGTIAAVKRGKKIIKEWLEDYSKNNKTFTNKEDNIQSEKPKNETSKEELDESTSKEKDTSSTENTGIIRKEDSEQRGDSDGNNNGDGLEKPHNEQLQDSIQGTAEGRDSTELHQRDSNGNQEDRGPAVRTIEEENNNAESFGKSEGISDVEEISEGDSLGSSSTDDGLGRRINYDIEKEDIAAMSHSNQNKKCHQNIEAIKLLKELEETGRYATKEEQSILAKYVGWGGIPQAFVEDHKDFKKEYKELKNILTEEEYNAARKSTLNAHYTPPELVSTMYDISKKLGFNGGRILEPSMGTGFFFGLMPKEIQSSSKLFGVELDSITGRIAKQLYPNANIKVQGFETTKLPSDYFDMAIGNVPFGTMTLHDPQYNKYHLPIHDYFFAKSLDYVKPGGLVMFITDTSTMDSYSIRARQLLQSKADFVAAIRFPEGAFKSIANTNVSTDLIILRKKDNSAIGFESHEWMSINTVRDNMNTGSLNEYFFNNKDMLLGDLSFEKDRFGKMSLTLKKAKNKSLNSMLSKALKNIPENIFSKEKKVKEFDLSEENMNYKEGSYVIKDGKVFFNRDGKLEERTGFSSSQIQQMKEMKELEQKVREVYDIQAKEDHDTNLTPAIKELNKMYDKFVKKYGNISNKKNEELFDGDMGFYILSSLEIEDDSGQFKKSSVLEKRVNGARKTITSVDTPEEAISISLSDHGEINLDRISNLINMPKEEIENNLYGLIFKDENGKLVPRDEYLSGNVRLKLKRAKELCEIDNIYKKNVQELEKVIPETIPIEDIQFSIGSSFINPEFIKDFIVEEMDLNENQKNRLSINLNEFDGSWEFKHEKVIKTKKMTSTYGTDYSNALDLINLSLNSKKPTIRYSKSAGGHVNKEATTEARAKQKELELAFNEWLLKDIKRREIVEKSYNEKFNALRLREYDGSKLTFPGSNPAISLRPHQKNAVARILFGGNALLAHGVGAGKTYAMIAATMEMRRLGRARKPMMVVPNNKTGDFKRDFLELYPSAKILVADDKNMTPEKRATFFGKIAANDWDCIILKHSQLGMIPVSNETLESFKNEEIGLITRTIEAAAQDSGKNTTRVVKQLEKTRARLEAKYNKLLSSKKDDTLTFEELGIDALLVDEAHNFKNLETYTKKTRIPGISTSHAEKTSDLYMKTQFINKMNNNKNVVFATATPISNSVTEMFTMMRYLAKNRLKELGIDTFDVWAKDFGEITTALELGIDGNSFRTKERFSKFINVPELLSIFREFTDIKFTKDLDYIELPKENQIIVETEPTTELTEFIEDLITRSENVKNADPSEDNPLLITNDGRYAAVDLRLLNNVLGYEVEDNPNSKINKAIQNVFKEWNDGKKEKTTQMIFLDIGIPKNKKDNSSRYDFDLYSDIVNKLVNMGVPEKEIAMIHNFDSDKKKNQLFKKMNDGEVRILIGSTAKMGEGVNAQKRMKALHHIDAPWKPSHLEQRDGRIVRQGNMNKEVNIYKYVAINSFDAYLWQMLERKATFIAQAMKGDLSSRTMEDLDETVLSSQQMKAIASGNPLIMEKINIDNEISELESLKRSFKKNLFRMEKELPERIISKDILEKNIKKYNLDIKKNFDLENITIQDKSFKEKTEAAKELIALSKKYVGEKEKVVGKIGDFEIVIKSEPLADMLSRLVGIKGEVTYWVDASNSESGMLTKLSNLYKGIDKTIGKSKERLELVTKNIKTIEEDIKKTFSREKELKDLLERQAKIISELGIKDESDEQIFAEDEEISASAKTDNKTEVYSNYSVIPNNSSSAKTDNKAEAFSMPFDIEERVRNLSSRNTNRTSGEIKSPNEIITKMSRYFEVPVTNKRIEVKDRNVKAYYLKKDGIIVNKDGSMYTFFHELGHHLDKKYKLSSTYGSQIIEGVINDYYDSDGNINDESIATFLKNYPKDKWFSEAFAEFLRKLVLEGTDEVEKIFPKFYKSFFKEVSMEDGRTLLKASEEVQKWFAAEDIEKQKSTIHSYSNRRPLDRLDAKLLSAQAYAYWIDDLHGIDRFVKSIEKGGKEVSYSQNPYVLGLRTRQADVVGRTNIMESMTTPEGEIIDISFKELLDPINKKDFPYFEGYLKDKHALDVVKQNKQMYSIDLGNDSNDIQKRIDLYEQRYPHFKDVSENIYGWYKKFFYNWTVKTNLISEDTFNILYEKYPHYVPSFRVQEKESSNAGQVKKGFANQRTPLQKLKGSGRDTYSPIEGLILQVGKITKTVLKNEVMRSLSDLYKNNSDVGMFLRKVGPEMIPQSTSGIELKNKLMKEIIKTYENFEEGLTPGQEKKLKYSNYEEVRDRIRKLEEQLPDVIDSAIDDIIVTFVPNGQDYGEFVSLIGKNGEKEHYQIMDSLLLDAVKGLDNTVYSDAFIGALARLKRIMTNLTTGSNPIFGLLSNAPKDFTHAYIMGEIKNPVKYLKEYFETIFKDVLTHSDYLKAYRAMGGGYAHPLSTDRKLMTDTLNDIVPGRKKKIIEGIEYGMSYIEKFNEMLELAPRLTIFKDVAKKGELTDFNTRIEAWYKGQDGTINFSKRGKVAYTAFAQLIPFFNAGLQGLDQFGRMMVTDKKQRTSRLLKSIAILTLTSLLMEALYSDDDDYEKVSQHIKDNFWLIKCKDNTFIRIPKPRELGILFGALPQRIFRDVVKNDKEAWSKFVDSVKTNFTPPLRTIIAPYTDTIANKDWSGRPIISKGMEYVPDHLQFDDTTSSIAKAIGSTTKNLPGFGGDGYSPKKADYLMKQYGGVISQVALPALSENSKGPLEFIKRKVITDPTYSNDTLNDFYEMRDKLTKGKEEFELTKKKSTYYNLGLKRSFDSTSRRITDLNKRIKAVQRLNQPEKRKEETIKHIKKQILELAEKQLSKAERVLK